MLEKRLDLSKPNIPGTNPSLELGPRVESYSKINTAADARWRPSGTLVAHFTDHTGVINQIETSIDNRFFASCSDDSTLKIWDTDRLHTNVSNKARLSTHGGMTE